MQGEKSDTERKDTETFPSGVHIKVFIEICDALYCRMWKEITTLHTVCIIYCMKDVYAHEVEHLFFVQK